MAKKKNQTRKNKSEPSRKQRKTAAARKTAIRKMRAAPEVQAKVKAQAAAPVKTTTSKTQSQMAVSMNRAEGLRLFKVAGRPTREQVILVYGERGPRWTWAERAKAGVSAKQFQAALEAKLAEKGVSRPAATK